MPLSFQPRIGAVVRCDFKGMIEPEMVKHRDVVVIAKHPHNAKLVTVVPLSTTQPRNVEKYHFQLAADPRPEGTSTEPVWAKCDMVYTLSLERLDFHHRGTRRGGREIVKVHLPPDEIEGIRQCVAAALNLIDNSRNSAMNSQSGSA